MGVEGEIKQRKNVCPLSYWKKLNIFRFSFFLTSGHIFGCIARILLQRTLYVFISLIFFLGVVMH